MEVIERIAPHLLYVKHPQYAEVDMAHDSLIEFACPECGRRLRAPIEAAGKSGKCNGCGSKTTIPSATQAIQKPPASDQPSALRVASVATKPATGATGPATGDSKVRVPAAVSPTKSCSSFDNALGLPDFAESAPASPDEFASALSEAIKDANVQHARIQNEKMKPEDATKAIVGSLPKRSVSMAYRIHLLLVATTMLILPMIYVAMVISAGLCVVYYTFVVTPTLLMSIRPSRIGVFLYAAVLAPILIGIILVAFMIKPLFFRIRGEARRRSLKREAQPVIFALVDRICDATGAPRPARIDVDYQVNASASPESGLFSIATGRMVLTIGVPLIAGMSARQLSGVLAHEFGHFSQKVGMGTSLVIRRVNNWFYRVVYQRDSMDVWLDEMIGDSDARIGIVFQLAQVGVWISRGILWLLMMIGHAVSSGLMRQMEFDADRYEYGLIGGKTFEQSCYELKRLHIAQDATLMAMLQFAKKGRLVDDMIQILMYFRRQHSSAAEQSIRTKVVEEKTSLFSTHPSDASRIEAAKGSGSEGIFHLDRPASELFWYFDALSKGVTWDFYRDQLGSHIMPDALTPTSELLSGIAAPVMERGLSR
ncbi:MAG: M48 family metalloprotease [Pirellula sp.]|jgi:Zn-dependent protease with chaperone function|nr:M48 family metalloprotease [Pirellula sp.]